MQVSQLVDSTFYKHNMWGRDVQPWVKPLHNHHHHNHHHHGLWKTEIQSRPTEEGLEEVGKWAGVAIGPGDWMGLLKRL